MARLENNKSNQNSDKNSKEIENNTNVSEHRLNKLPKNWPYSRYFNCFNLTSMDHIKLLIPTVYIRLDLNGTIFGPVKAMLDTGAQATMISSTLFNVIRCPTIKAARRLIGIDARPFTIKRKFDICVRPWFESNVCLRETVWILPEPNEWNPTLPSSELDVSRNDLNLEQPLADPIYNKPTQVHIILGVGFFAKIINSSLGTANDGTTLLDTDFGVVMMGEHFETVNTDNGMIFSAIDDTLGDKLNGMLERLWEQDKIGSDISDDSPWSEEERMVEEHFMSTYKRDQNGRFIVKIPFKENINTIGSSRQIALHRFMGTERRLNRMPELKEFYVEQMREAIRLGHMVEVTRAPLPGKICYHIPHHCVTKKPRVVYDGSCKTNTGVSLNEVQMLGPKLQTDLHTTLMRFRRHEIALCADIKKMFNQVKIDSEQWDCQRIFWRENENEPLKEYWLTVVTFGLTSSAHLSVRCVIQAAREAADTYPEAAKVIELDFYMDDCVSGSGSILKTIELGTDIKQILAGAGFDLRKWKSNNQEVLDALGSEEQDSESEMVFSEDCQTSVLGVKWLFQKDQFTFVVKTPSLNGPLTKRKIVSCVAQLYDPDGYISPVTTVGKIIIQELWKAKLDWDDVVDQQFEQKWKELWDEIYILEQFTIDRWIGTSDQTKSKLIGFSDSSMLAYGAVIYVRTEYPNGTIKCNLLTSKSRVAPLKPSTIPRLELSAAELLARLMTSVSKSMEFENMDYILWTDSSVTLYWIRKSPSSLKTFVSHRVKSIQDNSDLKCWRYVNTKQNPADLLSRGAKPSELVGNKLWLHGPEWLQLTESQWPQEQFPMALQYNDDLELRVHAVTEFKIGLELSKDPELPNNRVSILDYSDKIEKAQRVLAYVIRAVNAIRNGWKKPKRNQRSAKKIIPPPSAQEKAWAMEYYIRKSQEEHFNPELTALKQHRPLPHKSKLEPLKPILDERGVIRVGGRLDRADIGYEMRHPAIIPKGSRLATLLMDYAHRVNNHGGIQVMMQFIRQKYWIPQLRDELRKYTRTCIECVRHSKELQCQLMGDLPADRVRPGRAFRTTGVDYAGPFYIKYIDRDGNLIKKVKAWVVLFVCTRTKAIHLDFVDDLSSASFIECFECFVARRGQVDRMYSDNGTSFVGAEKEVAKAYKRMQQDGTVDSIANKGTEWNFMTPAAPHQGGIYEAGVKSMKYHLKRVVGSRTLEQRQFKTLLCKIEATLNSRPLTALTDDPNDLRALTPAHFLIMEELVAPPQFQYATEGDLQGRKLWEQRQELLKHFEQRWINEYLTTLQERKKWRREKENVKVGQLVLLKDENQPPSHWKMARIREVHPGKDNLVRNVVVETTTSILRRPVQKICLLPVDCAEKEEYQSSLRNSN